MTNHFCPLVEVLLRLVAVSHCAPGSSTTGPGANTVGAPRTPFAMDRLKVQLLVYTHSMSAILHVNTQETHTDYVKKMQLLDKQIGLISGPGVLALDNENNAFYQCYIGDFESSCLQMT